MNFASYLKTRKIPETAIRRYLRWVADFQCSGCQYRAEFLKKTAATRPAESYRQAWYALHYYEDFLSYREVSLIGEGAGKEYG